MLIERGGQHHTANQGWIWFRMPPALGYKAIHGVVDLYVKDIGRDLGYEVIAQRLENRCPSGFSVAQDTVPNTVFAPGCHVRSTPSVPSPLKARLPTGRPSMRQSVPAERPSGGSAVGARDFYERHRARVSTDGSCRLYHPAFGCGAAALAG